MTTNKLAHKLHEFKDSLYLSAMMAQLGDDFLLDEITDKGAAHYFLCEASLHMYSHYYYTKEVLRVNRSLQKKLKELREQLKHTHPESFL